MKWTFGILISLLVAVIAKHIYVQAQIATGLGVGWPSWDEWILILAFPVIIATAFFSIPKAESSWKGKLDKIDNKLDKLNDQ